MNVHMGSDVCGVAAETTRQVLVGAPAPGVLHSGRATALEPVISALETDMPNLGVAL